MMLSTNCEKEIQIVVIQYTRNSIITGPTVCTFLSIRHDESWSKMLETELNDSGAVAYVSEGSISDQEELVSDDE